MITQQIDNPNLIQNELETIDSFTRFKDSHWLNILQESRFILGGAGGINSWVAFYLARAGAKMDIYDNDVVSDTNIGGQFYSKEQVDLVKVDCLYNNILQFCENFVLNRFSIRLEEISNIRDVFSSQYIVYVSGFDNMKARKLLFEKFKKDISIGKKALFIDGRLLAESFEVYFVNSKSRMNRYEETLFDDSLIPDAPCTYRAVTYSANLIAGYMFQSLINHFSNKKVEAEIFATPFKIRYDGTFLNFQTYE